MPVPTNKTELILAIKDSYAKLRNELTTIPLELINEKQLDGHVKGTLMSVSDLVAYLLGWGELVLKWDEKINKKEPFSFPETGYKWNELGKLAQKFYFDYPAIDYSKRLDRLDETVESILQLLYNTSNEELYHKAWYGKWRKGKMIQLNTYSPYKNARTRVRKWKKMKAFNKF
ncbi:ClbS/DfsB family four-helix bundle protein [Zunongwangia sp.]|uniref:ClbS/DfsB family four-helix bundle protein n=1 Tax=Zunongwangia sp. TaxID=1965325 RepID=UPI003AA7F6BF